MWSLRDLISRGLFNMFAASFVFTLGTVALASSQTVDVLYFYNANPGTYTDMCSAIAGARAAYPGQTLDARGFSGLQYCAAANATTMLGGNVTSGVQGKLLLGNVTLVIDGPTNGTNYTDGNSSGLGTPAVIIPNQHWGIQGISRFATTIEFCTGVGVPVLQCAHAFPQRAFTVNSTAIAGTTLTVTVSGSLTLGTNIYVGEYVDILGAANPGLPPLRVMGATSSTFKVSAPAGTATCNPCSGSTAYLMTPVVGFGPGGSGAVYSPQGGSHPSFGQHLQDVAINLEQYVGASGLQDLYCQETCGINRVSFSNLASIGFEDYSITSQNGGPWTNIVVSTGASNSACGYGTAGAVLADAPDRGIQGWTMTLECMSGQEPVAAIVMDKDGTAILHGHNEGTQDAVLIGSQGANLTGSTFTGVSGVDVEEVVGPPSTSAGTNIVHVSNIYSTTVANVFQSVGQQTGGSTNAIRDDINGYSCTDAGVSYYETDYTGTPSTDCSPSTTAPTQKSAVLNAGTLGFYNGSTTASSSMTTTQVLAPLYTAAGNVILKPGSNSTQAIQLQNSSGGIFASFDSTGGQFRIGGTGAPGATLDVNSSFQVNSGGTPVKSSGVGLVGAGLPGIVYNTVSVTGSTSISARTSTIMATAPATSLENCGGSSSNATCYRISFYAFQVSVGTSCGGSTNIAAQVVFTDPTTAAATTVTVADFATAGIGAANTPIAPNTSGTGITLVVSSAGGYVLRAAASTNIEYATSVSGGGGCISKPTYWIIPILEQL